MKNIMEVDGDQVSTVVKGKGPHTLQVRFVTKQQQYAIPDFPYELPSNVGQTALNTLLNQVLTDDGLIDEPVSFDFLVGGEFLRDTLEELVLRHEALKAEGKKQVDGEEEASVTLVGTEEVFDVEYMETYPSPQPKDAFEHDDWVASIDAADKWILTGCYDATLHLWTSKAKHKHAIAAHSGPVKKVCWVSVDSDRAVFASGSHDQTIMIWEWDFEKNNTNCRWICKGHERSVESLKVDPSSTQLASGSWDGQLKIWSSSIMETKSDVKDEETAGAVGGAPAKPRTRTPVMSLAGHKESISALAWSEPNEVISASWDHTIKLWDIEGGAIKSELSGNKAFFDMSWSPQNRTVVTASADRHVRLYDPRSTEGSIVKSTFTSHSGWVSSVNWSPTTENIFISGSYDKLTKIWDRRSPRAPLYNLTGHTENILCTNWSNPKFIMSGGADNTLRLYQAKTQ